MHIPITININSVSCPTSAMVSQRSKSSLNCETAIRRMAATETNVWNRRFTHQS